ncbi:hypothetical protein ERD78_15620 [Allopusillimonas soli]|uniref:Uncharacterized protein n=1 Tax=Allopusillimonas soli TaxID=659016 RepID=A0A853FC41_9BURK|nr:hypothetical protein [Allopusillimonas soli]NYT38355.1 hypothetical protein [Allopusillimonas soli]TEA72078.1 hypothetical protein ERD78_15620 [Allopusillimonas soli]
MSSTIIQYTLALSFTVMVACALTALVSGLVLVFFRLRTTNLTLRHPYLDRYPWERYPFPIKAAMLMDYFFRLSLPKSRWWVVGNANRLLAHVNPAEVPSRIKWPLYGLWGGCFLGIAAMILLWIMILITMA